MREIPIDEFHNSIEPFKCECGNSLEQEVEMLIEEFRGNMKDNFELKCSKCGKVLSATLKVKLED